MTFKFNASCPMFNNNLKMHVSLETIAENYRKIKGFTNREVATVMKANAYGLGMEPIAQTLFEEGCRKMFVATVYEGVCLRKILGPLVEIHVLNCIHPKDISIMQEYTLQLTISSMEQLDLWLQSVSNPEPLVLHVDTGMNRLGFDLNDASMILEKTKNIPIACVMSHMACAENPEDHHNGLQLARFKKFIEHFPKAQYSLAASESLNLPSDYYFDFLRIGKALYGSIQPFPEKVTESLQFAFKTQSRIIQIRDLKPGDSVGYGATYTATAPQKVATLGIGFSDGLPRSCSNTGYVYIEDHSAPILGRISMDTSIIDVSHLPAHLVSTNTWVDIIRDRATLYAQAKHSNSGIYELVSRLGNRYERSYL